MKINLTKQQELALIQIGLNTLFRGVSPVPERKPRTPSVPKPKGRRWTDEQREKFRATMKKKYGKQFTK